MPAKFERIEKTIIGNRLLRGSTADEHFTRVIYEEVAFHRRHFNRCTWLDCQFRRTAFRFETTFENCLFENCKFDREHTYLGGPSSFKACRFVSCVFENVQFSNTTFENCSFPSRFINVVFYGSEAPKSWQTKLRDADFSSAQFEFVDFRSGIDLSTTRLPPGFVPENVPRSPVAK